METELEGGGLTLHYHFPTTQEKTRLHLARILQVLRDHDGVIEDANASNTLRKRVERYRVELPGTALSMRLKTLEDEGLITREIEGKRTKRIALGPKPLPTDLDARYGALPAPVERIRGVVPATPAAKRLADLQAHVRERHPAVWDNLEPDEAHDLTKLERVDAGLHERVDLPGVKAPAVRPQTELAVELAAIEAVVGALKRLDGAAACRVLRYALDRFGG